MNFLEKMSHVGYTIFSVVFLSVLILLLVWFNRLGENMGLFVAFGVLLITSILMIGTINIDEVDDQSQKVDDQSQKVDDQSQKVDDQSQKDDKSQIDVTKPNSSSDQVDL